MNIRMIGRTLVNAVDDIITGLDNGTQWILDRVGIVGILCLGGSAGLLWLPAVTFAH